MKEGIFKPLEFPNGLQIKNRLVMAPMATKSSFENGMVTLDELEYYKRRSENLGAVITSAAKVEEQGSVPGSISIATERHVANLTKLASTIHKNGTKAIMQLFHVGRSQTSADSKGYQAVSASAISSGKPGAEVPRSLSQEEVLAMIDKFKTATIRAIKAGFDGVEIHGANTYLIQQFFSPHSNQREDRWGGNLNKRSRFPIEIIRAVKEAVKEYADRPFAIGFRITMEERYERGITFDDSIYLLNKIKKEGIDYIHLSLDDYKQSSKRELDNTISILQRTIAAIGSNIPIIGVGNVHDSHDVRNIFKQGASLVAVGRQLIIDPDWAWKIKNDQEKLTRTVLLEQDKENLKIPDKMWEYMRSRPGWLPMKSFDEQ
ncbi:NADH-dependent flavin oxidoreductase [Tetragenococcus halophilus subsp. flandriensis]|uniref:NADH-dependent flavin oxidoreductase n=1 Tax=Tetragenococcus halophilus TaxID=51669 RepID=UPI0023EA2DDB|nr:NADH-dependent flavin oxidoreductase [Tetragenococcus halophilus]GMA08670.1 NADH-dependent flavin oxidoreductase [Tetragenococcus halophilus subsp. flandriensis]